MSDRIWIIRDINSSEVSVRAFREHEEALRVTKFNLRSDGWKVTNVTRGNAMTFVDAIDDRDDKTKHMVVESLLLR